MSKRINIIAPIGELPRPDPDLESRLSKLTKDAPLSDVFRVISVWEKDAIKKFYQQEKTVKSGILDF